MPIYGPIQDISDYDIFDQFFINQKSDKRFDTRFVSSTCPIHKIVVKP